MAIGPTCGPLLISPPALKNWGTRSRQGLCSHPSQLWATSDFVPRAEALGTPGGRGYVATGPTCGPLLILSRPLVGRSQPTFSWSPWWREINLERSGCGEMSKECVKNGKVGGNQNTPYPQCEESIKIPVFKQQLVPRGTARALRATIRLGSP